MRFPTRLPLRLVLSALVPLAAATAAAQPAATPRPVAADDAIIPLPLTPIVPPAQRVCAMRTATGLGYTMLRAGSGAMPTADATALVSYVGYLAATGAVFDQSERAPMPVGEVIPGFAEGLQMLGRTGVVRLCIPAALGYGDRESGPIPAGSELVFQVELLDFRTAAEIEAMRQAQAAPAAETAAPPR